MPGAKTRTLGSDRGERPFSDGWAQSRLVPRRHLQRIQWNLEISRSIVLRFRQPPSSHVHLQGMQDKLWHGELGITRSTQTHELLLAADLAEVDVPRLLACHCTLPRRCPSSGHVIVAREETCLVRQGQDALDRVPKRSCITSWKVTARGSEIGHEQRVVDERRIADDIRDRCKCVPRREGNPSLKLTNPKHIVVGKQPIPLRAVGPEMI